MSLLHAHGSPTNYQYQHGCRCVACSGAMSAYKAAYYQAHRGAILADKAAYYEAHKDAVRETQAAYYQENRDERRARNAAHWADHGDAILEKQRQEWAKFTEWLQILRTANGCEDCETHSGRLLHHHVDPSTKLYCVSGMSNYSLDALEDELEKCVVLCVPCHNKRHVAMKHASEVSA